MPRADNMTEGKPIHVLVIGPSKVGKTWWALQAAKAGFNLVYLDGDAAQGALAQQPDEIKRRVMYMDMRDTYDNGNYVPRFATLLDAAMRTSPFLWNDTGNRTFKREVAQPDDDVWKLRLSRLGMKDVLVIDSATSLSYSIMRQIADNSGMDITEVDKAERSVYAAARNKLTGILNMIQVAPCHVIMVAHSEEWEQRRKKPGLVKDSSKEDNMIIVGTRQVPSSVSKQFGSTMAKFFTDVGWMSMGVTGERVIDFSSTPDREAGGRFTDKKSLDDYSFAAICKASNVPLPGKDNPLTTPGLEEIKASVLLDAAAAAPLEPTAAPAKVQIKGVSGLAGILNMKPKESAG